MTDAATSATAHVSAREVLQRRLVGLGVLLLLAFLLSLLLRNGGAVSEELPAVVIPLNGEAPAANTAPPPTLGVDEAPPPAAEPEAVAEPMSRPVTAVAQPEVRPASAAEPKPRAEVAKPAVVKPGAATPPAAAKPSVSSRWYVVVGSYKDPVAAGAIAKRVQMSGFKAETLAVTTSGERFNRVRAGPFKSRDDAESARVTLIVEGMTKAFTQADK